MPLFQEKLDYIYDTTGSFKDGFNEKLQSFTGERDHGVTV